METVTDSTVSDKLTQRAAHIVASGLIVRLDTEGGSVANREGYIYRVDYDLGGKPNCQCRYFHYHGDCKHLRAVRLAHNQAAVTVNAAEWKAQLRSLRNLVAESVQ